MDVLFLSPAFPVEMPHFTQALARVGARVIGVGDGPVGGLPKIVRESLSDYIQVRGLLREEETLESVQAALKGRNIDRVECLWEPGVMLAAKLRRVLGVPGMDESTAHAFRDKETMKRVLDAAGVRTPRHARASTTQEARAAAERIGFPLIIKPIDGAGSADTYPVRDQAELEETLELTRHVPEVSVEEYIEGEELTFDTICRNGEILYHNVAWYRPKPLIARLNPWISAVSIVLRDTETESVKKGRALGEAVLKALGFQSGFTHMEWFLTPAGEAVFGEIGARPPGARLVHAMNYSCDADFFEGWAEAICHGSLSQNTTKHFNVGLVFKRAEGDGIVRAYEGLDAILFQHGEHIPAVELVPIGSPRQDWKKSAVGDGWLVVRHPDFETTIEIADKLATHFKILAR